MKSALVINIAPTPKMSKETSAGSSAQSAAVDALVAAGITSSKRDMAWLLSEIKKREPKATTPKSSPKSTPRKGASTQAGKKAPEGKKALDAVKEVFKHTERLKYQDEDWKARDAALERLERLITDGALACEGFTSGFQSNLKDLVHSLVAQLYDLRSVIVKSAVQTLAVLMTEVGDNEWSEGPMRTDVLEGLLQLSSSGNKVLSAAGRNSFPHFIEMVRFESMLSPADGILYWLRGIKNAPVKLCCLNALLQVLQTWPLSLLTPSNESIEVALVEAAAHSAGDVRGLARQCLLQHLDNSPRRRDVVDKMLVRYPDTTKQLQKEVPKPGALSMEQREAPALRQGEAGAATRNGRLGVSTRRTPEAAPPKKPSLLKRLSSSGVLGDTGRKSGGSLRDMAAASAAEQMLALKERQHEMSEEEYAEERQRIIQAV